MHIELKNAAGSTSKFTAPNLDAIMEQVGP